MPVKKKPVENPGPASDIERILGQGLEGAEATAALMPLVYEELLRLAAVRLSKEKPDHNLDPAALVDEAYLRLIKDRDAHWENKRHFYLAAAEAMRRILIDDARRKKCLKRGGGWIRIDMEVTEPGADFPTAEIGQVHEVLEQLEAIEPESAQVVKLRFFSGMTLQQCAETLGISKRTADNRWAFAREWLHHALSE